MERAWPRRARRVAVIVFVILLLDGIYVSARLAFALLGAGDHLQSAASSFSDRDFEEAEEEFQEANDSAADAAGLSWHPSYFLARAIPGLSADADAIHRLAEASEATSAAGLIAVDAVDDLGLEDDFTSAFYSNGRVDLKTLEGLQDPIAEASRLLSEADSLLEGAPEPHLELATRALDEGRTEISEAAETARRASLLVDALPEVTGGDKSYLLAFQAPSESRGTGGLMGMLGILNAKDGRIGLGEIVETSDVATRLDEPVDAPRWYVERYASYDATQDFKQANLSAHFPTVAQVWLDMYEQEQGKSLDGVIAMDPLALQDLMVATGSIRDPESNITIASNTVAEFMMRDSYAQLGSNEQPNVLRRLVEGFWERVESGDLEGTALAEGMGNATRSGHLKVYMEDDELAASFRELEADGDFTAAANSQIVFHNNSAGNKVDFFMHRQIDTDISLSSSGEAVVRTRVRMENRAPNKGPQLLLGPYLPGDPPGMNRAFTNISLPAGAEVTGYSLDGQEREVFTADEAGRSTVWDLLEILPGEETTMLVEYRLPGAVTVIEGGERARLALSFVPQATAQPDRLSVSIEPPDGFAFEEDGDELASYTWRGDLMETHEVELELVED